MRQLFVEIFSHRHLVWALTVHDFRAKYLGSALGFVWSIILPLVLISVYALIFQAVVKVEPSGGQGFTNFGLFIFCGMLPWLAVHDGIQRGANVFVDQAHLLKQSGFPPHLLPLHIVLSTAASSLISVIVFILVNLAVQGRISPWGLLILVVIPFQILFVLGLTIFVSALNVFFRDLSHLVSALLMVWFFATPIVYPEANLPQFLQKYFWINPLTPLVRIYRAIFLRGDAPSPADWIALIAYALIWFIIGSLLYNKAKKEIIDWV